MLKFARVLHPMASAIAALLLVAGLATPAQATYGGGACLSCAPAPVENGCSGESRKSRHSPSGEICRQHPPICRTPI